MRALIILMTGSCFVLFQFFICLGDLPFLDNKYTVFGKMTKGDEVLRKLASAKTVSGDIPFERQGLERIDQI